MLNPNEIHPKHLPSLQSAILRHRSVLDEHLVSKLYAAAKSAIAAEPKAADSSIWLTRNRIGDYIVATCTDVATGLFVQLSGNPEKDVSAALVTFGQKFCQEIRDTMRHNAAITVW